MKAGFVLKGNVIYSKTSQELSIHENSYLVCVEGRSAGIYPQIPESFEHLPVMDMGDRLIIPGLVDMHVHASQNLYRGLGMDRELLDWLETYAFPEESKFQDPAYAEAAYQVFTEQMRRGATTRACIFATIHREATEILMDKMEAAGLKVFVGKVNMDRNSPDYLREEDAEASARETEQWVKDTLGKYEHVVPMLTPRFVPSCTDELLEALGELQREYKLPVQSHISENPGEIAWVKELCPAEEFYGAVYDKYGLFGGDAPTVMAHCVWSSPEEVELMKERGVFIAHCPQSNMNVASGIAPMRLFLDAGLKTGLGSDIAGGSSESIFRAMVDARQVSGLLWRLVDQSQKPLSVAEVFWMGTAGGGEFFGKVGKFDEGYEFDAVVLDDSNLQGPRPYSLRERLERIIYLSDDRNIYRKYVAGRKVWDRNEA